MLRYLTVSKLPADKKGDGKGKSSVGGVAKRLHAAIAAATATADGDRQSRESGEIDSPGEPKRPRDETADGEPRTDQQTADDEQSAGPSVPADDQQPTGRSRAAAESPAEPILNSDLSKQFFDALERLRGKKTWAFSSGHSLLREIEITEKCLTGRIKHDVRDWTEEKKKKKEKKETIDRVLVADLKLKIGTSYRRLDDLRALTKEAIVVAHEADRQSENVTCDGFEKRKGPAMTMHRRAVEPFLLEDTDDDDDEKDDEKDDDDDNKDEKNDDDEENDEKNEDVEEKNEDVEDS